jgi:hypothetical protein
MLNALVLHVAFFNDHPVVTINEIVNLNITDEFVEIVGRRIINADARNGAILPDVLILRGAFDNSLRERFDARRKTDEKNSGKKTCGDERQYKKFILQHKFFSSFRLSVTMQSRQQIAYAQIGKNNEQKRDDSKVGGTSARPTARNSRVQKSGVSQPRD